MTSSLFQNSTIGALRPLFWAISANSCITTARCLRQLGEERSHTCTSTSASATLSSVALKAATMLAGSLDINPTVSVSSTSIPCRSPLPSGSTSCCVSTSKNPAPPLPPSSPISASTSVSAPALPGSSTLLGSRTLRVVGSRVAKSMSSARTPALLRRLSMLLLPALVYPTRATRGMPSLVLLLRCACLWSSRLLMSVCSNLMRVLMLRLSNSSLLSPGPLNPAPVLPRSPSVSLLGPLVARYCSMASSTCSCPSRDFACCAKMSRMTAVRSSTFTEYSSVSSFSLPLPLPFLVSHSPTTASLSSSSLIPLRSAASMDRCCLGFRSSSTTTVVTPAAIH
mmetsp:Transcript_27709/g.61354  ORF Transcript_27709/g.61354 Transcript_27709/m.61354 type:complete len:339 (+) Transcript_27709:730-1746(+)